MSRRKFSKKFEIIIDPVSFQYSGTTQYFDVQHSGNYAIECWGAQGNYASGTKPSTPGKGAYCYGEIYLMTGDRLSIEVGGGGETSMNAGYNGGGSGNIFNTGAPTSEFNGGGGGYTSIKLKGETHEVMIAAGGGGASCYAAHVSASNRGAGDGGTLTGNFPIEWQSGYVADQSRGGLQYGDSTHIDGNPGSSRKGGDSAELISDADNVIYYSAGGGGGYYGGGSGCHADNYVGSGQGGSSYISGHPGCTAKTVRTMSNTVMTSGARIRKGLVKITPLFGKPSESQGSPTVETSTISGVWVENQQQEYVLYTCESPGASNSAIIRFTFSGVTSITFDCISQGENNYDYLTIGNIDESCTRSNYYQTLKGNANNWVEIEFTPSDLDEHFVEFCYSKDSSVNTEPDNATVYISKIL